MNIRSFSKWIFVYLFPLLVVWSSHAQNLNGDVEFVVNKIRSNYPGFKFKTNERKYNKDVRNLINKHPSDTFRSLSLIVNSFSDQHLRLYLRKKFIDVDSAACSERLTTIIRYLNSDDHLYKYEGFWRDDNKSCVIGIRRLAEKNKKYEAVLIESRAGQLLSGEILFSMEKLSGGVYLTDFRNPNSGSRCFINSTFRSDTILVSGVEGKWRKLNNYNASHPELPLSNPRSDTASGILINSSTYLVSIPSSSAFNIKIVEGIFEKDSNLIAHADNLIIDIRGNLGGRSAVFDPIYPWIYTNPIIDVCGDMYSSKDGIEQYIKKIESMRGQGLLNVEDSVYADSKIKKLKTHLGEFVLSAPDTLFLTEIRTFPKKVGVIMDYACQSAAEMFILNSKQSKKVLLFGENSRGAIDYLDFYPINTPSNALVLFMPVTKRRIDKGEELDGIGIEPNVFISDNESNWVKYAEEYLFNL